MKGHPVHVPPEVVRRIIKAVRARHKLANKALAARYNLTISVVESRIHDARCEGKL